MRGMIFIQIFLALFFTSSGGNEAAVTHSFRHQHGARSSDSAWHENGTVIPQEATSSPDLLVRPREEVFLSCYIPSTALENIGYGVTWLHNGLIVDVDDVGAVSSGRRHHRDPATGQLHISSIRLDDDGLWQCQFQDATMDQPTLSKPLKLVVLDKPRSPYLLVDGRRLDPGNLFIPVKENLELQLACVIEGGNPPPTIKWLLALSETADPSMVPEDRANVALNITNDGNHNYVTAYAMTRSDARLDRVQRAHHNATILCIAHHPALKSPVNASILLDVQYTPSFAISREPGFGFPLREGIAVSLKCDVDSNPAAQPVWLKDDGSPPVEQSVDGFLNFTAIRREHSGWYKCTTHHLGAEFSSIGYFLNVRSDLAINASSDLPLDPYPSGRLVEVPLGGAVQLQCPEEAMGCWSRVGPTGRLEPVGPGRGLLLSNVIYQDAGEYRCASSRRAEYDRWRSEVNVDVTVFGRPLVYPVDEQLTVQTGQRAEMSVEYCANPPAVKTFWVTETQRLTPGQSLNDFVAHNITAGSSIHCHMAVLTINSVLLRHAGEYMFLVRSANGIADGTVILNVTLASGYSFSSSTSNLKTSFAIILFLLFGLISS